MKIGIFGGTFNPPHLGHKKLVLDVMKAAHLDKVIIIPTFTPPHKTDKELICPEDRYNMCLAMFSEEIFTVSDIEISREGKSYTYDTVCLLRQEHPEDELYLIMGSDMLLCFDRWYRYEDILSMVKLAVTTREADIKAEALSYFAENTLKLSHNDYVLADTTPFECSSTFIRARVNNCEDVSSYLHPDVYSYIIRHKLYEDGFYEYKKLLKNKLDDHRYIHSLGVARSAAELADIYGYDRNRAYFAGLMHDVMKNATFEEQLQIITKGGIILNHIEENNKALWHAIAGEAYLRCEIGVEDKEILSSVRYHTTGRAGMSLLEKIIYVADYISPERNYPDVGVMRDLALNSGLEEASVYALKFSFKKFATEGRVIHPDSVDYYNELIIGQKG